MEEKVYHVQPVGLSTMRIKADEVVVDGNGVNFYRKGSLIYFSHHSQTRYVSVENEATVVRTNKN